VLLFAGARGLLLGGTASAADLLKAPPAPAAVPMFGDFQDLDSDVNIRRGAFKIQENESPRPADRVNLTFNYYNSVDLGTKKIDVQRETLGFEKTFLDGNASLGARLPFFQNLDNKDDMGDITLIGKFAFLNDRMTGNVISGGIAITRRLEFFQWGLISRRMKKSTPRSCNRSWAGDGPSTAVFSCRGSLRWQSPRMTVT
jgi:hypothetical protein